MNELICTIIVINVAVFLGGIIHFGMKYGPKIWNSIRGFIKWNMGKFKKNYWD